MSYTNDSKQASSYIDGSTYLHKEDDDLLLLEDNYYIVLDQAGGDEPISSYTNESKP